MDFQGMCTYLGIHTYIVSIHSCKPECSIFSVAHAVLQFVFIFIVPPSRYSFLYEQHAAQFAFYHPPRHVPL
jgi:hypothetical protein